MKLKFKKQAYQTNAVEAVVDCFAGQPKADGVKFRVDPGRTKGGVQASLFDDAGFRNSDVLLPPATLLDNIRGIQRSQSLPLSDGMINDKKTGCNINLDVEMETGTGKTYCYIKTLFELNKRYGWSKYIIVVPSIAIREGVYKSLEITAEHFLEEYGKKARFFIYNSKQLHNLESFSSDAGINVMVINVQAFNASGGRFGFKLISAVSARGDMHFDVIEESMNAEKFINFLKKLRQDAGCPVFAIADNARYHHSKKVQEFLETQIGEIMMAFLPAYSPELNPDEQVWNHAKSDVGKRPIKSKLEMETLILSAMQSIQQKIELVKSFFRLPDTLYAEKYI